MAENFDTVAAKKCDTLFTAWAGWVALFAQLNCLQRGQPKREKFRQFGWMRKCWKAKPHGMVIVNEFDWSKYIY